MADENSITTISEDEQALFKDIPEEHLHEWSGFNAQRRLFLKQTTLAGSAIMAAQMLGTNELFAHPIEDVPIEIPAPSTIENVVNVTFKVNGTAKKVAVDSRMTLLDTFANASTLPVLKRVATMANAVLVP